METNEVEKKNIELDIDDEQLKLKLDFENEKKRLVILEKFIFSFVNQILRLKITSNYNEISKTPSNNK